MIITHLHEELMALPRTKDSAHFLEICRQAKAEISSLLDELDYEEASRLTGALHKMFYQMEWTNAAMMAEIMPIFPANKACTLEFLGKDDAVDQLIFASKLNIGELRSFDERSWTCVLRWARKAQDLPLIERVVLQIVANVKRNKPNNDEHVRSVSMNLVQNLAIEGSEPINLGDKVDAAIAGIISYSSENNLSARNMPKIASHGLRKTFMRLIEKQAFAAYLPHYYTDQQNQAVYDVLPADPTPAQTFWIQRSISQPGINERILFDPDFDMDEYIEVLRPPCTKRASNLCFPVLKLFRALLTPENLNTPDRQRRASKLINAVVDHQMKLNRRTTKEIRSFLEDDEFHPYTLKLTRVLKGTILEEELGL